MFKKLAKNFFSKPLFILVVFLTLLLFSSIAPRPIVQAWHFLPKPLPTSQPPAPTPTATLTPTGVPLLCPLSPAPKYPENPCRLEDFCALSYCYGETWQAGEEHHCLSYNYSNQVQAAGMCAVNLYDAVACTANIEPFCQRDADCGSGQKCQFACQASDGQRYGRCSTQVNRSPRVSSVTANPSVINTGESSSLNCDATDPDGDPLTYSWARLPANAGSISPQGANATYWASFYPNPRGSTVVVTIFCSVFDGRGGQATGETRITVLDPTPTPTPFQHIGIFPPVAPAY